MLFIINLLLDLFLDLKRELKPLFLRAFKLELQWDRASELNVSLVEGLIEIINLFHLHFSQLIEPAEKVFHDDRVNRMDLGQVLEK